MQQKFRESRAKGRRENALVNLFWNLIKGLDLIDFEWMLRFNELREKVYYYNNQHAVRVSQLESSEIPWPIIWLTARYHKAHIFWH